MPAIVIVEAPVSIRYGIPIPAPTSMAAKPTTIRIAAARRPPSRRPASSVQPTTSSTSNRVPWARPRTVPPGDDGDGDTSGGSDSLMPRRKLMSEIGCRDNGLGRGGDP